MSSARDIARETRRRMGTEPPAAPQGAASTIPEELRCSTPNCPNRWTCNFARGRRCASCDERMASSEDKTRQLFPRGRTAGNQETPDESLPF